MASEAECLEEAEYLEAERRRWQDRGRLCHTPGKPKCEFWAGTVTPLPEPDFRHSLLVARAQVRCGEQLRGSKWSAVTSRVRVCIETPRAFVYPDVLIAPHSPAFYDDERDTITNPRVIIEIVSAATREHDRGAKLLAYQTLPSLTEYVLVADDEVGVEHHRRRADGLWRCSTTAAGSWLVMESIGVELPVDDIYRKV